MLQKKCLDISLKKKKAIKEWKERTKQEENIFNMAPYSNSA